MTVAFKKTTSVCPVCLKTIEAEIAVGNDNNIHMMKTCSLHGSFDTLIWEGNVISYLQWAEEDQEGIAPITAIPSNKGCPNDCGLCQNHHSEACCVLLELTSRCNLHCPVCFASAKQEGTDLPLSEIKRQYDLLMEHGGPYNIQLSGGEPTLRDDLDQIVQCGKERGFTYFQLNTNGLRIAEEEGYAKWLKKIGISCVFLQFDTLNDEVYEMLRGKDLVNIKQRAVDACIEAGLPVVLVPVIVPGINEGEIGSILAYAMQYHPHVRGVHFQPVSYFGRVNLPQEHKRITIPKMLTEIEKQTERKLKTTDFSGGGAESPYCSFHASYRRKADGTWKALQKKKRCCCAMPSSEAMQFVSRQWGKEETEYDDVCGTETSSLDLFLKQAVEDTFTVSGMLFQDAWNLDLQRLKRCYICEADSERGMIPFCAYNLTDCNGKALYRK